MTTARSARRPPWPAIISGIAVLVAACGGDIPAPSSSVPIQHASPAVPAGGPATAGETVWPVGGSIPSVAAPPTVVPLASDAGLDALAAARARWETSRPATFGYTVTSWNSSGFGAYAARVVSLEGAIRIQPIEGQPWSGAALAPDTLFGLAGRVLSAPGTSEITYDAKTGLPTMVRASGPPGVSDADTNISVSDLVVAPSLNATGLTRAVTAALSTWRKAEPSSFTYTWTRTMATDSAPEAEFDAVREAGGDVTITTEASRSQPPDASAATIPATLATATAAASRGAWVDLTTGAAGVPLLLAVDPTPRPGDGYWIQIAFLDIEREQAAAAYRAARDRWGSAALTRYRYVWRYTGDAGTYAYRVTMRGDVSLLRRAKGSAVLWQSFEVGPRLDVLFSDIGTQLGTGGRVVATYDPANGHPVTVRIWAIDGTPSGTITITGFVVE